MSAWALCTILLLKSCKFPVTSERSNLEIRASPLPLATDSSLVRVNTGAADERAVFSDLNEKKFDCYII